MKVSWGTGYLYSLKYIWTNYLWITKGKKGTFTVEKSGGHQVIKVNITNNGINWHHVPPDVMHWGHNITYVIFLPKMHNLKLVMRKQSDKPKTEGQSTKNLTYTVQKCQCVERLRNCACDPGLDSGSENWNKGYHCYTGQGRIYMWTVSGNSIILMLNCLNWNIVFWLWEFPCS